MTTIDVLRQALDALEFEDPAYARRSVRVAIATIRAEIERLEKVEQEPRMQVVGHGRENGAQYLDITLRGIAVSHIRAKALEEAAQTAEETASGRDAEDIAAAIRRMKGKE